MTSFRPNRSLSIPSWPFAAAYTSGARPYIVSGVSGLTYFCPSNSFTVPSWPFLAAHESGVRPNIMSGVSGLTSFCSNSRVTIPSWPFSAAHKSGVRPYFLSRVTGLTSLRSNSSFATPSWPFSAAQESGVRQYLLELSGLMYLPPNRISTACAAFPYCRPTLLGLTNCGSRNNLTTPSSVFPTGQSVRLESGRGRTTFCRPVPSSSQIARRFRVEDVGPRGPLPLY